jgi:hypothetical protein
MVATAIAFSTPQLHQLTALLGSGSVSSRIRHNFLEKGEAQNRHFAAFMHHFSLSRPGIDASLSLYLHAFSLLCNIQRNYLIGLYSSIHSGANRSIILTASSNASNSLFFNLTSLNSFFALSPSDRLAAWDQL